jgi:hypothetical protein
MVPTKVAKTKDKAKSGVAIIFLFFILPSEVIIELRDEHNLFMSYVNNYGYFL